jgi:hydroxymethylbilane synthase
LTALRIGTRGSLLALAQARAVAAAIEDETELVEITTAGDVDRSRGDKSRWTGALEAALLAGDIDLAVHSAKDVPGDLAEGTSIVAALRRADPSDVLAGERSLDHVREGASVGTSALRRRAQLLAARPDLDVRDIRGNVDTRLRKLAAGEVDVLVLAAAGLDRLQRRHEAGGALCGGVFVPAAGQGVIAVQARTSSAAADAVSAASHARTMACLLAERAAVRELSASCHAPVGIHAEVVANELRIRGFAGLPDGSNWVLDELVSGGDESEGAASADSGRAAGPGAADAAAAYPGAADPDAAGRELARRMKLAGADDLLREAEAMAT